MSFWRRRSPEELASKLAAELRALDHDLNERAEKLEQRLDGLEAQVQSIREKP